jgi:Flp pilus assembly protein TadG
MYAKTLIAKLRNSVRRFAAAQGGNITIIFALTTIPVIGLVGAAVDYSRANSAKTAMQAAIDATALMLSKEVSGLTPTQMATKANAYFAALFHRTEVTGITITPVYTTSGGSQVVVTGTGTVPTSFTKIMGFQQLPINVSSTVKWGSSRLRVALVLDTTGSMADDGKIGALKTATKNLLSQLQSAAAQNGDVYVSIIPFSKDVNVDAVNYSANWIDWTDWNSNNGSCSKSNWSQNYSTKTSCTNAGGSWTKNNHNTWNGCVSDRGDSAAPNSANYDENVSPPVAGTKPSMFSAEQYSSCSAPAKPLSYDWAGMTTLVNNLSPNGNTNQSIGLAHGWMSLVGGGPYPTPPAKDPNYTYQTIIILLTDGLNTQNRWYTTQSSIDARQKTTCDNIYAAGITLYTIQVNTGGDPTSTLLQNCAGDPTKSKYPDSSKFYLLTSANAIVTTFNQIGTQLSKLRVAK